MFAHFPLRLLVNHQNKVLTIHSNPHEHVLNTNMVPREILVFRDEEKKREVLVCLT